MLMKVCPQCGSKIPQGKRCSCSTARHKLYNRTQRDKVKDEFYHSKTWRNLVASIKARANGLDEYALSLGIIQQGNTVHHIHPIDERPDLKLSPTNLIYVSARTHNHLHSVYDHSNEEKRALQAELQSITAGGISKSFKDDHLKAPPLYFCAEMPNLPN